MNYSSLYVLINHTFTEADETYTYVNESEVTMLSVYTYAEEYQGGEDRYTSVHLVNDNWTGELEEYARAGAVIEVTSGATPKLWQADYPTRFGPL